MRSPSCTRAIGPPTAASGDTWPTTRPYVPPENRPSVMSPTASPSPAPMSAEVGRSEEHTSELQSQSNLVCRLLLEKKKQQRTHSTPLLLVMTSPAFINHHRYRRTFVVARVD